MSEKIKKIRDNNNKNREAQIKCQIFHEDKKEKIMNNLIEKMIHKSDVLESSTLLKLIFLNIKNRI